MARSAHKMVMGLSVVTLLAIPRMGWSAPPSILFILDVSGSMAQRLGDQTKMQAAKQAFGRLLGDLSEDTPVGLEVYGHRGKKDCSAIEIAQPVGPLDARAIQAKVLALVPSTGATPIAAALERAGGELRDRPGARAIVLISDGEETCGGDPVAVAARLRNELGIDVVIHVVGLDVTGVERAQLEAIARKGGGSYYAARNAADLEKGLTAIEREVASSGSTLVFEDDFDGDALGEAWEVIRPSDENLAVENGKLLIVLQPGWPTEDENQNLLLCNAELPPAYEVEAHFEAEVVDFPDFRPWETQRVGLVLYAGPQDLIEITTSTGGVANGHPLQADFGKYKNGEWVSSASWPLEKGVPEDFQLRKQGHKYAALVKSSDGEWHEVGSATDLKAKYRPGILAYRASNARESAATFDRFEIRSSE